MKKFRCLKNCEMEYTNEKLFTAGNIYPAVCEDESGFIVLDDEFDNHNIGMPGVPFFDEYFEETQPASTQQKKRGCNA